MPLIEHGSASLRPAALKNTLWAIAAFALLACESKGAMDAPISPVPGGPPSVSCGALIANLSIWCQEGPDDSITMLDDNETYIVPSFPGCFQP